MRGEVILNSSRLRSSRRPGKSPYHPIQGSADGSAKGPAKPRASRLAARHVASPSCKIRLELQAGSAVFRQTVKNRSRLTLLGLSVQYAWRELKKECPGLDPRGLVVQSMALEATLGWTTGKKDFTLADAVRIFKRLSQDRYAQITGMPCDLWAPGFIEVSLQ